MEGLVDDGCRNLYPQIIAWHNLYAAWRKARKESVTPYSSASGA